MTKEELNEKIKELKNVKISINAQICSVVKEYIKSLPYKEGDKVCINDKTVWIASIKPECYHGEYTGKLDIHVNPAKKDGTRSRLELHIWEFEQLYKQIALGNSIND